MDYYNKYLKYKGKYQQHSGEGCNRFKKTKDPKCADQEGCMWVVRKGCIHSEESLKKTTI